MITEAVPLGELVAEARQLFYQHYQRQAEAAASAPGRVNLIGEHTDYNEGFVLPMALPLSTVMVGARNGSATCRVVSRVAAAAAEVQEPGEVLQTSFPAPAAGALLRPGEPAWANYVKGVVANFPGEVSGFDAVLVSTVPLGGGVSSSASLEVAVFTFLEVLTGRKYDCTAKALACQKAEHQFAGMPCGIMDQFISTMGKEGSALLIDCRSLESTLIPMPSDDVVVLVTNSNVKHQLTGSEYPTRRAQCQNAAALLSKASLREATLDDLKELKKLNADEIVVRRAEHVIAEIARTQEAAKCLKDGDFKRVGELFYESHESLRTLFEVSCPELDQLVEAARAAVGVLGSRMTGGGFGGCTVTLVYKKYVNSVIETIKSKFSGHPTFYVCRPSDGAQIIPLD